MLCFTFNECGGDLVKIWVFLERLKLCSFYRSEAYMSSNLNDVLIKLLLDICIFQCISSLLRKMVIIPERCNNRMTLWKLHRHINVFFANEFSRNAVRLFDDKKFKIVNFKKNFFFKSILKNDLQKGSNRHIIFAFYHLIKMNIMAGI